MNPSNSSLPYFRGVPLLVWCVSFALLMLHGLPALNGAVQIGYFTAATIAQAALLALPAWLLVRGASATRPGWLRFSLLALLHLYAVGIVLAIDANYQIYALYGFYINGFVWNIISTPGGLEALGFSNSFYVSSALRVLLVAAVYTAAVRWLPLARIANTRPVRAAAAALPLVFLLQGGIYAYADHTGEQQILQSVQRIPWYSPVTAKGLLSKLGVERKRPELDGSLSRRKGKFAYPAVDAQSIVLDKPYNIVWLTSESWRADMLDPRIMPKTYAFARDNVHFLNHYSGGNGTRMGMFSQFYGLHGNYWFDALPAERPPLLLETLRKNSYSLMAYTSARFSYPEFDRTVFRNFSPEQLHSDHEGDPWQRDIRNVSKLTTFINSAKQPFFSFMFFESTHANYSFPAENALETDYLEDFNYLDTDIKSQISRIKARYINASHHLDSQFARVLRALKESGRLDNTIVVITGDHGEEFMENGRWGHNSTFVEQQVKVPLVLHIPGQKARTVERMTSHVDLPITLLSAMSRLQGIDKRQVSLGHDLLDENYRHDYLVVSDWHGSGLIAEDLKLVLSAKASDERGRFFTRNDQPLAEADAAALSRRLIGDYLRETPRFYSRRGKSGGQPSLAAP
ncbi:sulfatase-like hydrolase/transferase [Microbulbifer rhizosphaerae]|uniref:Sulfatase n=1 Tax=Microbulbifer rhizosphaerae TaxID=1562603 RepID=A0A7W4WDX4_9GAMM|nr:sulfatase-like hydrolase/transferase [Microbulbifer rhizosphaerae]MBB3062460.1 hypothetical protein [Microbulbifer rhizosphaerae]